jgi:hypothetical protein
LGQQPLGKVQSLVQFAELGLLTSKVRLELRQGCSLIVELFAELIEMGLEPRSASGPSFRDPYHGFARDGGHTNDH